MLEEELRQSQPEVAEEVLEEAAAPAAAAAAKRAAQEVGTGAGPGEGPGEGLGAWSGTVLHPLLTGSLQLQPRPTPAISLRSSTPCAPTVPQLCRLPLRT